MGLGSVTENGVKFLSIAGGYIWDRKAGEEDPNYAEQKFERADKTEGIRKGARYADLTGNIVKVEFKTHQEFGESINVTIDDEEENRYVISIQTGNRYSQDFMKALMKADLSKPIFIKPYDFVGNDKKRAQGISFRQGGEKLDLKIENAPTQTAEWFKAADKKKVKRFFEDLTEWFVGEIQETVIPKIKPLAEKEAKPVDKKKASTKKEEPTADDSNTEQEYAEDDDRDTPPAEEEKKETPKEIKKATPLAMKQFLKEYIAENYEGNEFPSLSKEDVVIWYNLAINLEPLPFDEYDEAEVDGDDIEDALNALLPKQ